MKIIKRLLLLCFLLILVTAPVRNSTKLQSNGLFEQNLDKIYKSIDNSIEDNSVLSFNSIGGLTSIALKVSDRIAKHNITIVVSELCISNCAEIILPSGKKVIFRNDPIVGFHGNMQASRHYINNFAEKDTQYCNWLYADAERKLMISSNLNPDFWTEQAKRLKPKVTFNYKEYSCPRRNFNFDNDMWLPTSAQLKELWGLEFKGTVCADIIKKCRKKIDRFWKKGSRIVIGDEVYISKGRLFPLAI